MEHDIRLILASFDRIEEQWRFATSFPSEHGFSNPLYGVAFEEYRDVVLPRILASHNGIVSNPAHVPDSFYYVYLGDTIIGIIKLRHRLNEELRKTGHGHIGYGIAKQYRGKGYGKEMLRQGLEILRSRPDFTDEYILLSCDADNIASLRTQLSCGGVTYRKSEEGYCQIFSGKEEAGFEPSDFDPTDDSVTPFEGGLIPPCPPKMVICFFLEQIQALVDSGELILFFKIPGENVCQLYRFRDSDVLVMPGFVGAPMTGGVLDEILYAGVKQVLCIGGAGVLKQDMEVGGLMLVRGAIREEGFSFHYMPKSRKILANNQSLERNSRYLQEKGIPHEAVIAYTTDAYFRETKIKLDRALKDGASCVEMEQAGLIALSIYRGFDYSAILYGGDDLSGVSWDSRAWKARHDVREGLLRIAKEILEAA